MKFSVQIHARGIDYPRFRQIYFSEQFNREIVTAVGLQERTTTEHLVARDGRERMRVRVVPRLALPAVIARLLEGHVVSYEEVTIFDPATRRAALVIETPAGDVVQVRGQACLHDEPNGVRMQFVGEAQVRFLGLGAMIERFLVDEVTRRYQMVERALQHYIDEGREMPAAPVGMTSASQVGLLTGVQTTKGRERVMPMLKGAET